MLNNYNGKLAWVFRHFPLPFHPKAQKSAEATECAADAGGNDAFWKMVDRIFATMPEMTLDLLPTLASELGLDQAVFQQCLDSGKYEQKVKDQMVEGTTAGVEGTPHNIIYDLKTGKNTPLSGALPYDQLKTELDTFISQK